MLHSTAQGRGKARLEQSQQTDFGCRMSHKTRSEEHIEADGLGLVARTTNDGGKGLKLKQPDLGLRVSHSTAQVPVQARLK